MAAIHRRVPALQLDVHVVSLHTRALVQALAQAGAARLTFQYELLAADTGADTGTDTGADTGTDSRSDTHTDDDIANRVVAFAKEVRATGMLCGVCLVPGTHDAVLAPLLSQWHGPGDPLVDYVDVLAVQPGVGGQPFDAAVLDKVRRIHGQYQQSPTDASAVPRLRYLAVDGGIDHQTARAAADAGANVLIAGTAIFGKQRTVALTADEGSSGIRRGMQPLWDALRSKGH